MTEYIMDGVELLETIEVHQHVDNPKGIWLIVLGVIISLACGIALFFIAGADGGCGGAVAGFFLGFMVVLFIFLSIHDAVYPQIYTHTEVRYRVYIHNDTVNYSEFDEQYEVVKKCTVEGEYIIRGRE